MAEIENLSITISAGADAAYVALDRLISKLNRTKIELKAFAVGTVVSGLREIKDNANSAADALDRFAASQERANRAMSGFSGSGFTSTMRNAANNVNMATNAITRFVAAMAAAQSIMQRMNFSNAFGGNQLQLPGNVQAPIYTEFVDEDAGQGLLAAADAAKEVDTVMADASEKTEKLGEDIRSVDNSAQRASHSFSAFWNSLRRIGSGAGGVIGKIGELKNHFGGGLIGNLKKSVTGLGQFFSSIKRIAMYRLIRTVIKEITKYIGEGMKNLYNWSKATDQTFAKSMDKIATASKYMGNSFAAMVSPLINALAPVIDFIADKIVDLFNLINQVFARLSGETTYTAAKKIAAEWEESDKNTSRSVGHMKRTILGFDEINKLQAPNGGSGSGSSNADNAANMFETRTIEGGVTSFVDAMRNAFMNGDWQTLGSMLGGKVDEMIRKIDFASIGSTVGYYINGLFSTKYWTLDAINFQNIGGSIATFLNNAIANIDFGMIARSWVQDLTIVADTIIGFFTNFDFGQLAGKLSDFAVNFFDEITRWLNTIDWYDLGQTVWTKIVDFFSNIDYEQLFTSIFTNIGTSIRASTEFLGGIVGGIFESLWGIVTDWWNTNIVGQDSGTILTNVLQALFGVNTAITVGRWVTKNILNPLLSGLFGIDKQKLDDWADTFFDNIKDAWDRLLKLPGKVLNFIVDVFKNPGEWWDNVKKWWHETTVGKTVDSFLVNARNTAQSWWNSVQAWWHETTLGQFVDGFLTYVIDNSPKWWSDVQHWWEGKVGTVMPFITAVRDDSQKWWQDVLHWWEAKVGTVQSFITSVRDDSKEWWDRVKKWWHGTTVGKKVDSFLTSVRDTSSAWWNSVQAWWHNTTVGKAVDSFLTNVKDTSATWWSNVVSWWEGVVNSSPIKKITIEVLDTVKEWWEQIVQWWNEFVSGKWLGIKIGFGDGSGAFTDGIDTQWNADLAERERADLQWQLDQYNLNTQVYMDMWTPWQYWGVSALRWAGLEGLRTTVTVDLAVNAARNAMNGLLAGFRRAKGGIFANGVWSDIPQYAGGTTNAGSLFLAGEAGPEIVGHVGGRTEVLNKSQIASAMFSAVQAAMAPAAANFASAAQSMGVANVSFDFETLAEMIRQGVEQAMGRQNELDRQRNEYLRQINEKDYNQEISTASINRSQNRMNRRAGTTIVAVGN